MELFLAHTWAGIPEQSHGAIRLLGFIQLVASIWLAIFLKKPER